MNEEATPYVPTRDELIGYISDTYKEINGFRPRGYNFSELSYEQLDQWGKELSAEAITHRKEEAQRERRAKKLRHAEHKAWEAKKQTYFKPVKWTIGQLVKI